MKLIVFLSLAMLVLVPLAACGSDEESPFEAAVKAMNAAREGAELKGTPDPYAYNSNAPLPGLSRKVKINTVRTWMLENCPSGKAYTPGPWSEAPPAEANEILWGGGSVGGHFRVDPATHKVAVLKGSGYWCID
jgi:hypothetical protein